MGNKPMRRAKGNGGIRERGNGSWELRYYGPCDIDGNQRRVYETVRSSRRDVERTLRERVGVVVRGDYVEKSTQTTAVFGDTIVC